MTLSYYFILSFSDRLFGRTKKRPTHLHVQNKLISKIRNYIIINLPLVSVFMKSSLKTFSVFHRIKNFKGDCVPLASIYMYLKSLLSPLLDKCVSNKWPSALIDYPHEIPFKSVSANALQVFRISHKGPSEIVFKSILRQTLYLRRLSSSSS